MAALSAKLRSLGGHSPGIKAFVHWCPGCNAPHTVYYQSEHGPQWQWNGDAERPTVRPSVRLRWGGETRCHYYLTEGRIEYMTDCAHHLAGQSVELPDWPYAPPYEGID